MTEHEKQEIITQCHQVADIQAKSLIQTLESIEGTVPDISDEDKHKVLKQIMETSLGAIKTGAIDLGNKMQENIKNIKLEDLHVG
jgi:hypothetical protein